MFRQGLSGLRFADVAKKLSLTLAFARDLRQYVERGRLPPSLPRSGGAAERETAGSPLAFLAIRAKRNRPVLIRSLASSAISRSGRKIVLQGLEEVADKADREVLSRLRLTLLNGYHYSNQRSVSSVRAHGVPHSVELGHGFTRHHAAPRLIPIQDQALVIAPGHDVLVHANGLRLAVNRNVDRRVLEGVVTGTRQAICRRVRMLTGTLGLKVRDKQLGLPSGASLRKGSGKQLVCLEDVERLLI